jgi:hypothetical protein
LLEWRSSVARAFGPRSPEVTEHVTSDEFETRRGGGCYAFAALASAVRPLLRLASLGALRHDASSKPLAWAALRLG